MALDWKGADQAGKLLTELQAIDPATLATNLDRALLSATIGVLIQCPATFGTIVVAHNDDTQSWLVQVIHQPFGSYAI